MSVGEVITLPDGVGIDSITPSAGTCTGGANGTWTLGNLAASASATLTVVMSVGASTALGTDVIADTATIIALNETDSNAANDEATESTSVTRQVDLKLTKTESIGTIISGSGPGNLSYIVTVANHGPSDASDVEASETLTLPAGVTIDSITPSAGSHPGGANDTWTLGDLANGADATLTVVLTVDASAAEGTDSIGNTAAVASVNETDTNAANDSAGESTSIILDAPSVTAVLVRGTAWTSRFIDEVAANGLGDGGFAIMDGSEQLDALPWINVDQIILRFSEQVTIDEGDLTLTGTLGPDGSEDANVAYSTIDFRTQTCPTGAFEAVWTLSGPAPTSDSTSYVTFCSCSTLVGWRRGAAPESGNQGRIASGAGGTYPNEL